MDESQVRGAIKDDRDVSEGCIASLRKEVSECAEVSAVLRGLSLRAEKAVSIAHQGFPHHAALMRDPLSDCQLPVEALRLLTSYAYSPYCVQTLLYKYMSVRISFLSDQHVVWELGDVGRAARRLL